MNRQKEYSEGKNHFPICLFPEGTTTNGRTLIEFKKGAFLSLSHVKPYVLKVDNSKFPLGSGGMNLLLHIGYINILYLKLMDDYHI